MALFWEFHVCSWQKLSWSDSCQGWVSPEESYFFQDTWEKLSEESERNWNKVKDTTKINVLNTVLLMFDINSISNR